MPLLSDVKLRILTFPQHISGASLNVRVLLVPTQRLLNDQLPFPSQLDPGTSVDLPMFINADLGLDLVAIRGLGAYPFADEPSLAADGATMESFATGAAMPSRLPELYEGLRAQFHMVDGVNEGAAPPKPPADGIRKYLPISYRTSFNFTTPRTPYATTDDSYHCAIKRASERNETFKQSPDTVTWGRVVAFCFRQWRLAERIGLLYRIDIDLGASDYFKDGGWVWCQLTSADADFALTDRATQLRCYAARIAPIAGPRQLFAPVLFPVVEGPAQPTGDFDTLKIEASDYDDGFAKVVHAMQPVSANVLSEEADGIAVQKDVGIRLGWDDEQLLIWQNRQLLADPATPGKVIEAPLGVFSYRVDVREDGDSTWHSLVKIRNKRTLKLADVQIVPQGTQLETGVQVFPSTVNGANTATFWLPSYFAQWYGPSLVLPDARAAEIDRSGALAEPGKYSGGSVTTHAQEGGLYEAVLPDDVELKYGHTYEFRVRLADLAGGGPSESDKPLNVDPEEARASVLFQRHVVPKQLSVTPDDPQTAPDAASVQVYEGRSFTVTRPRLGYPALLFTELDTDVAMDALLEDAEHLHPDVPPAGVTNTENRDVSYFDPDVDQILVVVDVKTLLLDTQASASQREPFIRLYSTIRSFDHDPDEPFTLQLDYRPANVIDFREGRKLGDLDLEQADIDATDAIPVPFSRDVRITLYAVSSFKPANPHYFGFAKQSVDATLRWLGEPVQFYVRENAADELAFFKVNEEGTRSDELQGMYLQPDPPQVNNPATLVAATVEGTELRQSTMMGRLAAQLRVDFKGLTLFGKAGQRVQFGCSHRIRHTLAPDNSSVTFATPEELLNHWLCVLSFHLRRDWTWDGLADTGILVERVREFVDEGPFPLEEAGRVELRRAASRSATVDPDRTTSRIVFIDAVEPKKEQGTPETLAHPFPNLIDVTYTLTPTFVKPVPASAGAREAVTRSVRLPITTSPTQVPKIVGAGYALSPYQRNHEYSETAVRQRSLWIEFEKPIADPNDTYFARVLGYAPDPLLSFPNPDQVLVRQDDPPLAIDPELIRIITAGHGDDNAGIGAMQPMEPEIPDPAAPMLKISPTRYLLPLPPGLHAESPELFGFFTYELRVGHKDVWCTAHGRYGHPMRLSGVQHPAPPLKLLLQRTPGALSATAPYAVAVFEGRNVTSQPRPHTEIWCMLYAQVLQADARRYRNLLIAEARLDLIVRQRNDVGAFLARRSPLEPRTFNALMDNLDAPATGSHTWTDSEVSGLLESFNLDADTPVSVLAVEMMPRYEEYVVPSQRDDDIMPLSRQLGQHRILRTSALVAAPGVCCENC